MVNTAVIRMVKAVLADPTAGANAVLAAFPLDGSDPRPEPLVKILDPSADDQAVTQKDIPDWPVAVVTCENPADAQFASVKGPWIDYPSLLSSVPIVTRDTVAPAVAWNKTSYYLAACVNSLLVGLFGSSQSAIAARSRGRVTIVRLNKLTYGATDYNVPGGKVTGALLLDLYVRYSLT